MAKSIEQRIQELEDRDEIKELTARYCWHVAHGEGEAVANLFADDGVLDVKDADFKAVRGREALLKFYRASVREPEVAMPFIQNHIIEAERRRGARHLRDRSPLRAKRRERHGRGLLRRQVSARAWAMALRRTQIIFPSRGSAQAGLGRSEGPEQEGVVPLFTSAAARCRARGPSSPSLSWRTSMFAASNA